LFTLAVVLALLGAAYLGAQTVLQPWSVPLGDRPTLTGEWVGTIRTASTLRLGVGVRFDYYGFAGRGSSGWGEFRGIGQICNRRGDRFDYNVRGITTDWTGAVSNVTLGSVDTSANGTAVRFQTHWDGDRITLTGVNEAFELDERPIGARSHLIVLDPLAGDLRRAAMSSLVSVCRALATGVI
jgi:hypothetical protein